VASQSSLHGQFSKAIQRGNLLAAESIARDLGGLPLGDALELVGLIARQRPHKLEAAGLRWHGRLELEARALTLTEAQYALAVLGRLSADPETIAGLRKLLRLARPMPNRP
jgi:hypothetical protein